jgi:MFS family permease
MSEKTGVTKPASGDGYRKFVLVLLMIVYVFNFIDRQILVILQESIKADMGLSDSQLALLSGFSFAVFYVTCGIPIARWADRANRVNIIAASLTVWSLMTAICGLVSNFTQLLLARIGVGIGEAGASPPSHSIISDYFPFESRGRALSIYSMGIYIGILVGFLAGGWIDEFFGWRVAFLVVGLPGVLLAVVVRMTLREPIRGFSDTAPASEGEQGPILSAVRQLWALRSFRYASLGAAFNAFVGYGGLNFMPSFVIRLHQMPVGQVGTYLALIVGFGGAIGAYAGGQISDRLGCRDARWYYWVPGFGTLFAAVLMPIVVLTDSLSLLWVVFFINNVSLALFLAPTIAMAHSLVGPKRRALASAVIYFVLNIIGLGLGPLTVGIISDLLMPSTGAESLRWALLIVSQFALLGAGFYFLAARHLLVDRGSIGGSDPR